MGRKRRNFVSVGLPLLLLAAGLRVAAVSQSRALAQAQAAGGGLRGSSVVEGGGVRVTKDVLYGEAGGQKLLLDAYLPAKPSAKRPGVLIAHGGGWAAGDKSAHEATGRRLAQLGYVALSINYRLATPDANKYPAQLDDTQRAVRWARANAQVLGLDPARLGALGDSAGGHLVSLLGTMDTRDNSDAALAAYSSRVACVVDLYGPSDLTRPLSAEGQGIVQNFIGKTPQQAPDVYRQASPRFHIDKKTVPFLIFQGKDDTLVPPEQSQILHKALQEAGIETTLVEFEGEGHGFQKPETIAKFAAATQEFLAKHLARKP